jgi:hypothetical protein
MAERMRRGLAYAILGTIIPAQVGAVVRGPYAEGVLWDWLAGAGLCGLAASVAWAAAELGAEPEAAR